MPERKEKVVDNLETVHAKIAYLLAELVTEVTSLSEVKKILREADRHLHDYAMQEDRKLSELNKNGYVQVIPGYRNNGEQASVFATFGEAATSELKRRIKENLGAPQCYADWVVTCTEELFAELREYFQALAAFKEGK